VRCGLLWKHHRALRLHLHRVLQHWNSMSCGVDNSRRLKYDMFRRLLLPFVHFLARDAGEKRKEESVRCECCECCACCAVLCALLDDVDLFCTF
jgi:hypothetical protein